jgi:transcriptional regulator with XRE-family HTH domain
MITRKPVLMPSTQRILMELGENIRLSRLRRKLSTQQIAERANISRSTLWQVEKGAPSVTMGIYCQVLFILGLEKDLLKIAADDVAGKKLMEDALLRKRAPKRKLS